VVGRGRVGRCICVHGSRPVGRGKEKTEKRAARAGIRTNSSPPPAVGCILCTAWRDAPVDL